MRLLVQLLAVLLAIAVDQCTPHPWLLFANRKDIRLVDASPTRRNGNVTVIIKDLEDAAALDYHYNKGMVCWTDISLEMIRCAYHHGASLVNKTNVITTGNSNTLTIVSLLFNRFCHFRPGFP
jgi:low density lipoprotein receptor-related protein 5/6